MDVCRSTELPGAKTRRITDVVWGADWADLSTPRRKSAGRASTSARIGALRVMRIDPSSGADTSSARTRGGGRPAELKVVTRSLEDRDAPLFNGQCLLEGGNVRQGRHLPAKSTTPLSKASRDVALISLKIYSPTSWYQLTNCGSNFGELMTKDSRTKESPSWTVRQFWTSAGTPKHAERVSCVIAVRALFKTSPLWKARGLPECYSDDLTAIVQFL